MDFTEVIKTRRSHRKFSTLPVSDEILHRILDAALLAPTWANMQGVRYVVVDDKDQLSKLAQAGQKWLVNAPMVIVVFIRQDMSGVNTNGLPYFTVDAAIALHQLILAATNEGLGTCWIGFFDEEKTKEVLQLPKNARVIGMTPIGYSIYTPSPIFRQNYADAVHHDVFTKK